MTAPMAPRPAPLGTDPARVAVAGAVVLAGGAFLWPPLATGALAACALAGAALAREAATAPARHRGRPGGVGAAALLLAVGFATLVPVPVSAAIVAVVVAAFAGGVMAARGGRATAGRP